ncbi:protein FAR1-RELATED SEQUENCE 5, partial [Sesamum alatum]
MRNSSHENRGIEEIVHLDSDQEDDDHLHSIEESHGNKLTMNAYIAEVERRLLVQVAQTENEAYELYQDYANLVGFSVRKGKQYYVSGTNMLRWKSYLCSKEGVKDERPRSKGTRKRNTTRTECKAMIAFNIDKDGLWRVAKFVKEHNHEFAPSNGKHLLRHFKGKANTEPGFYFDIQFNQEGRIANVFWRDNQSRIDYDCFGDLVIFDTTYRTNRYDLVCAPFVGVNHHWQNIMFGCAFLSDETTESFYWLFNTFLESMGSKAPSSIFTDQDQAMANAIAGVFPNARHRLCLWHISKNAPSHLNSFNSSREFHSFFNRCLYHCETKEEFEKTWEEMVNKFNAQNHRWLNNLYKIRGKWSPAFNSDFFHGGVRSTSRSESTNHALNEISTKTISLYEFVLKYEKDLLGKWRRNEADADFFSSQSSPTIAVQDSKILKHAVKIYTNTMYKEFEKDYLTGTGALSCKEIPFGDTVYEFELTNPESKTKRVYTVFLDINTLKVECSCKKYTWMGMLCSHALVALHRKNVHEIPQHYIHTRWTKNVRKHVYMLDEGELTRMDDKEARVMYTNRAMRLAYDLVTRSENCKEARNIILTAFADGSKLLNEFLKKKNSDSTLAMKGKQVRDDFVEVPEVRPILDPLRAKPKGTKNARIKNHFEKRKPKTTNTGKAKKQVRSTSQDIRVPASPTSIVAIPTSNNQS